MNCIVTGAAGFMGSHLVTALLDDGHKVLGMDDLSGGFYENVDQRSEFQLINLISDPINVDVFKPDVLFHLAADATEGRSQFTPVSATQRNVMAYVRTLSACIKAGVKRVVLTSSMSRYGEGKPPFSEDVPTNPVDVYGINKEAMEKITKVLSSVHGFDYTIVVPHNVIGQRQNLADPYRNVVAIFMNRIMRGLPPIIYGDGYQTRAFTHIDNFTPYILKMAFQDSCIGETINIGPTEEVTINYLAEAVITAMNSKLFPIYYAERPLEVKHAFCTVYKAEKLVGYKTTVSLNAGLRKMAEWAIKRGPQKLRYTELELITSKTPKTWSNKEM